MDTQLRTTLKPKIQSNILVVGLFGEQTEAEIRRPLRSELLKSRRVGGPVKAASELGN
jgi:hypothetical protein